MSSSIIEIKNINVSYGSNHVLKNVNLNIENKDFSFCIELPIKAKKMGYKLDTSKSNERARIGGRKKVNAFRDGFLILISMMKLFFKVVK